jgi:hypothetical protein
LSFYASGFFICNFLREKGIIGRKQKKEAEMKARLTVSV